MWQVATIFLTNFIGKEMKNLVNCKHCNALSLSAIHAIKYLFNSLGGERKCLSSDYK